MVTNKTDSIEQGFLAASAAVINAIGAYQNAQDEIAQVTKTLEKGQVFCHSAEQDLMKSLGAARKSLQMLSKKEGGDGLPPLPILMDEVALLCQAADVLDKPAQIVEIADYLESSVDCLVYYAKQEDRVNVQEDIIKSIHSIYVKAKKNGRSRLVAPSIWSRTMSLVKSLWCRTAHELGDTRFEEWEANDRYLVDLNKIKQFDPTLHTAVVADLVATTNFWAGRRECFDVVESYAPLVVNTSHGRLLGKAVEKTYERAQAKRVTERVPSLSHEGYDISRVVIRCRAVRALCQ